MRSLQEAGGFPKVHERPQGFQLELSHACNLRCLHCYNASRAAERRADMPFAVWERVVDEVAEMLPFQVILSGGEPLLLGERLFRLMDRLYQEPTRFVLITNGWLADRETIDRLGHYPYYWMQVSIDGYTPALHDEFRGVKGSWERAVRAAHQIAAGDQALVIAHTVRPANLPTLSQMIDMACVLGATRIICDEAMPVGRAWSEQQHLVLTDAEREALSEIIYSKQEEYRNIMEVLGVSDVADSFALYLDSPCNVLLIRPNGDVKLDCVLPFVIGNVRRQSLWEIWETVGREAWKHPRVQEFVATYQDRRSFTGCEARPYVDKDIYIGL
ncbi:MAG: radical SAM protein [Chloroflexi bacterium]|nr:radical SAM protein [Chloroflexota bacterium]